jgi:NAD-specific glutamate dehydrogenase
VQRGFSAGVAATLARGPLLREAFALLATVAGGKLKPDQAAAAFHRVGRELHVDAFDELLAAQVPANSWERRFQVSLEREAAAVRQAAAGKLAADPELIERNRERVDRIGDSLGTVKQLGAHGLVPLFLILEDYRALT